ncbi:hypothetical protein DSL72_009407 [Monilinia vaccinii-corymbosi]|uniref:Uncharacterized protein n=1 Tax=Monilinia vaccinii-corymbosi TaxID=61207 RepID=A0A8A3PQN3_9HELO|nr:hypothetical protein DSL72_009407 [Monilinia vaccinii-corymbosi]
MDRQFLSASVCPYSSGYPSSNDGPTVGLSTKLPQINDTCNTANTTFAGKAGALPMLSGNAHISNGTFPLSLVDISIGTADEYSPFHLNTTKSRHLFNNATITASRGSLDVKIDPSVPYLYLPTSTCDIITSFLPVIYHENTNLYLWNTTSSLYKPITSSPTYPAFEFSEYPNFHQNPCSPSSRFH